MSFPHKDNISPFYKEESVYPIFPAITKHHTAPGVISWLNLQCLYLFKGGTPRTVLRPGAGVGVGGGGEGAMGRAKLRNLRIQTT